LIFTSANLRYFCENPSGKTR